MMEKPTAAKGIASSNTKQKGTEVHSLNANLTLEGLKLRVESPNKWVILATVLLLTGGFVGLIAMIIHILR